MRARCTLLCFVANAATIRSVAALGVGLVALGPIEVAQAAPHEPLRTNQPVYENPFDLAAGGASLTRATQDGVLYANPSLPAFGAGFLRSIYGRIGVHSTKETAVLGRSIYAGTAKMDEAFLKKALTTPYHAGVDMSAGFLTSKLAFGTFVSSRLDLAGRQFGNVGLPQLRSRSYANAGAALGLSHQWKDLLALGLAVKPTYAAEANEDVGLDELAVGNALAERLKGVLVRGYGTSVDAGLTLQKRSTALDGRLAFVASDVGATRFSGGVTARRQTFHAGTGLTLHDANNALHCAVDYRDAFAACGEHWTKRVYVGCKAVSARAIGVAAGLYQGWPTLGGLVNLYIVRVEAGVYTREMGRRVGSDPRRVFFVAIGSEIP